MQNFGGQIRWIVRDVQMGICKREFIFSWYLPYMAFRVGLFFTLVKKLE